MWLFSFIKDIIHSSCKKSRDQTYPRGVYRDGKYQISVHAVDQMNKRKINKGELHVNLHTRPIKVSPIKTDKFGRQSYERYSRNKINSRVNPKTNNVNTVSRFHTKKYNQIMKGKIK